MKRKASAFCFCAMVLFIVTGFSAFSQTNWYSSPCSGSGSYYSDFGTITPNSTLQGVGLNGTNYDVGGPNAFWKGSFVVAAAGEHYCFQLKLTGSGVPYGGDGTNGPEIEILSAACGTASQTIIADFYTPYYTGGLNQTITCGCWTSQAADVGKTYYIQLSEGAGGGTLFGAALNSAPLPSAFCTVYFYYQKGDYTCNGTQSIVLPVELTKFTAHQVNTKTKLEWATASENNSSNFIVERSLNGTDFTEVTTVKAAGNSNINRNYVAFDDEPVPGLSYYRLKQVDLNGEFKYSQIISSSKNPVASRFEPNPATDRVSFNFYSPTKTTGMLQVIDITGRVIYERQQEVMEGDQMINTSLEDLQSGVYYFKVSIDEIGYTQTTKLIKN